jgi:transcriptional regulator with XRE-family HTH domain
MKRPAVKNIDETSKVFSNRVREIILLKNISQAEVSRKSEVGHGHLNRVLNARNNIGLDCASRIAKALDVSLEDLTK